MKAVLTIVGALALLMGLLWIGQGTGLFPYPASSFMIADTAWTWRGVALAVLGLVAILWARRH